MKLKIEKGIGLIILAGILVSGVILSHNLRAEAAEGERCFFTEPGLTTGSVNDIVAQPASYSSLVNTKFPSINLSWRTYAGSAWNAPELKASDGYSASLSGGSFGSNTAVDLAGTKQVPQAEVSAYNTYSLKIQKNGTNITSCSVQFAAIATTTNLGVTFVPPQPIPPAPASTTGKIKFVKTLFDYDPQPDAAQSIIDMLVWGKGGDKFVFSGEYGGSFGNPVTLPLNTQIHNGAGGGLWVATEDGSKIIERQLAVDAGSAGVILGFHAHRFGSGAIQLEFSNGGFLMSNGQGNISWSSFNEQTGGTIAGPGPNRVTYYTQGAADGLPRLASKGPEVSGANILALKDKIITGGHIYSVPDWKDLGDADPVLNSAIFSFGNLVFGPDGKIYTVSPDGSSSETGSIIDTSFDNGPATTHSFSFAYDNSTYPPRLAVWQVTFPQFSTYQKGDIKIYTLSGDKLVLNKTLKQPGTRTPYSQFAVLGDYVAVADNLSSTIELWLNGQKIDSVQLPTGHVQTLGHALGISRNGYLAVVASPDSVKSMPTARSFLAYLYKLDFSGTPSPSNNNNTPPGSGACTAALSFDKTSIPFGGSVTETWKVDGADVGATYADCGAGELQISAGPLSKTLTNMNQSLSCRIYGKINGAEACSATASVTVLPPTTGGGGGGGGDHFQANSTILPSDNSSGSSDYGSTTLKVGSVGSAVANLQKYLNQNSGAGLAEDGHFGPRTKAAVISWQTDHGLTADGLVGPQTKAALANAL